MIHAAHMHPPFSNKTATDPSKLGEEFKAEVRAALVRGQDSEVETKTITPPLNPNEQADYMEANAIFHSRVLGSGKQEGLIEDSQDFKDADEGVLLEMSNSQSGKKSKSQRVKKRGQHQSGLESNPEAKTEAEVAVQPDGSIDAPEAKPEAEVVAEPDSFIDATWGGRGRAQPPPYKLMQKLGDKC